MKKLLFDERCGIVLALLALLACSEPTAPGAISDPSALADSLDDGVPSLPAASIVIEPESVTTLPYDSVQFSASLFDSQGQSFLYRT